MLEATNKQVKASCGCGTSAARPRPLVYAVGLVGFDFGTEARRDAIFAANGGVPIGTVADLVSFLADPGNEGYADSVIWTLIDDQHPIYAIRPRPAFGKEAHRIIRSFLAGVAAGGLNRMSVPGWIAGSARLLNGQVVPVIEPDVQGIRGWTMLPSFSPTPDAPGTVSLDGYAARTGTVDLTALGPAAWHQWPHAGIDPSYDGPTDSISALTISGTAYTSPSYLQYTWSNSTSGSASASSQLATWTTGQNDALTFSATAGTSPHVLRVHVSVANGATGRLDAWLDDGSAPAVGASISQDGDFVVTISYQGTSPTTNLRVQWTKVSSGGVIGLGAAALALSPALPVSPETFTTFVNRLHFELRNKGASPEERAKSFVVTQTYFLSNVFALALKQGFNLQSMSVAHSPLCRPGSECLDVSVTFFDPMNPSGTSRKTFRFTVDVSDVKPVLIGQLFAFNSY